MPIKYPQAHRKQNKRYSYANGYVPDSEEEMRWEQMTKLRFEQVKINFLDNFLP
jgi:hypothetical protein